MTLKTNCLNQNQHQTKDLNNLKSLILKFACVFAICALIVGLLPYQAMSLQAENSTNNTSNNSSKNVAGITEENQTNNIPNNVAELSTNEDCAQNITTGTKYTNLNTALDDCKINETVKLLTNVSLTGNWTPVTDFVGTFDGDNKTITGLTINGTSDLGLLANVIDGGFVKNLTIDSASITTTGDGNNVAFVAGSVTSGEAGGGISNVTVSNSTITSTAEYVGGIIGKSYSSVTGCKLNNVKITGKEQVGGFVGYFASGNVNSNVASSIQVEATISRAGGLIGKLQFASLNNDSHKVNNNQIVNTTTNTANSVKAPDNAGGIAGQIMGDMASYEIKNNEIDIALNAPKTSPIAILRTNPQQPTTFTGVLATNITGNSWFKNTYNNKSYIYSDTTTGAGDQVINNTPKQLTIDSLNPTTVASKTYDGTTTATITLGDVLGTAQGDVVTTSVSGQFDAADASTTATASVTYSITGTDADWYAAPVDEQISTTIAKRSVVLTSQSASKVYDGAPLTATDVTVSGEGFIATQGATYDVTGSQTEVGTSQNTFDYTLNNGTSASNYDIQKVFGELTVTATTPIVNFHVNGGSPEPKSQTLKMGDKAIEPQTPVKDGYTFDGWYSDEQYTHKWDFDTPVNLDLDLYAKWTKQTKDYKEIETSSSDHTYVVDSGQSYSIRIDADADNFKYLTMDGNLVDKANYTVKSGSTIVTLNPDYLNTLSVGTHTVRFNYVDDNGVGGKADSTLVVKEQGGDTPVTPSDDSQASASGLAKTSDAIPFDVIAMVAISAFCAVVLAIRKNQIN